MKIQVATWNLENLFHPETGGPRYDLTPHEGWTLDRFQRKIERVAGALTSLLELTAEGGDPFVLGLTEVENEAVVAALQKHLPSYVELARDPSFSQGYLDCVVLYDSRCFEVVECRYGQMFERYERGDAVEVTLRFREGGQLLTVFCLHTKARPPERGYTAPYRQALCDEIQTLIWARHGGREIRDIIKRIKDPEAVKPNALTLDQNVIVMGDFNDEPSSSSLVEYLGASHDKEFVRNQSDVQRVHLFNCAWEAMLGPKPGSYYFSRSRGTPWSMLDQIVISPSLLREGNPLRYREGSFQVVQHLSCDERGRPMRMCEWDDDDNIVWLEGYSDHFPVRMDLELERSQPT